MPHRKAKEVIERQIAEIQDIVETCNLAPYKMDEYKKELKKLNEMLAKQRDRKGFTLIEGMIAVAIVAILLGIIIEGVAKQKTDEERQKVSISMIGEIEKVEYVSGVDARKTAIYWKNGTTSLLDDYIENTVPKGTRAKVVWDTEAKKYRIVPDSPFPAEVPR
jgi:prepilin-type N-terminal cleavage/methylation domain-containing protein